jgi:hypothetical protein
MNLYLIFSLVVLMPLAGFPQENKIFQSEKLLKKWETPAMFFIPESVCYNAGNQALFISNVNGKPSEKDGNGFISLLGIDGYIQELRWVTGLNAPKGMGIFEGKLYVTDIDRVAVIDIQMKSIIKFYEFPEAEFLNDIAIDKYGAVYISDMMSTRIYRINNGKTEIWLDDPVLTNPNGLFVEGNELVIGCNKIIKVGLNDKKINLFIDETGGIDGLEGLGNGPFLFSDWQGNIFVTNNEKKIEKLLDTTPAGINAADIEYIPDMKLLLVPTFSDNRVMAYHLE